MKKILAALAIAALAAVPFTAGAHDDEADLTVPLTDADASLPTLYVDAEGPGIWQETNGDPGLQTAEHTHGDGDEAITVPADTPVI